MRRGAGSQRVVTAALAAGLAAVGLVAIPTPPPAAAALSPGQARAYQVLVASLGFRTIADYQRAAHLPATGQIDEATRHLLLTPVAAPVHPS